MKNINYVINGVLAVAVIILFVMQFSSKKEEQSGYYFPFKLTKTGTTMTLKKNGVAGEGKEDMAFDPEIILRVSRGDTFTVEVDDSPVVTFNFKNVTWA